jgi:hypothetical protein
MLVNFFARDKKPKRKNKFTQARSIEIQRSICSQYWERGESPPMISEQDNIFIFSESINFPWSFIKFTHRIPTSH